MSDSILESKYRHLFVLITIFVISIGISYCWYVIHYQNGWIRTSVEHAAEKLNLTEDQKTCVLADVQQSFSFPYYFGARVFNWDQHESDKLKETIETAVRECIDKHKVEQN